MNTGHLVNGIHRKDLARIALDFPGLLRFARHLPIYRDRAGDYFIIFDETEALRRNQRRTKRAGEVEGPIRRIETVGNVQAALMDIDMETLRKVKERFC